MYPPRTTVIEGSSSKLPLRFFQSSSLKNALSPDRKNLSVWLLFALFVLFTFHYLSDRDFSFLLVLFRGTFQSQTLSSIVGSFGFLLGLYKVVSSRSVQGACDTQTLTARTISQIVDTLWCCEFVSLFLHPSLRFLSSLRPFRRLGVSLHRRNRGDRDWPSSLLLLQIQIHILFVHCESLSEALKARIRLQERAGRRAVSRSGFFCFRCFASRLYTL